MPPPISRREFLRASGGTALAFCLASCSGSATPPRTVRLAGGFFGFPSPFAYIAGPGYIDVSLIYDTLLWKDATGRLLPWLARSVHRSADGLTYTFELRDGIRWSDGRPLGAHDVAFTLQYFASQNLGPLIISQPFGVKGARALSRLVAEIRLEIPMVTFLDRVAGGVPIVPRHVWSTIRNAPQAQDFSLLVGTGPYRLRSFSFGDGSALYTENRDFFLGRPFIRRVELIPVDDELTALQVGELDTAETPSEGIGPDGLAAFRSDSGYGMVSNPGSFGFPLIWNLGRGGALADVRFRRACALAIDRQGAVRRLIGEDGTPGNPGFLPPSHPFYTPVEQYEFNPRAAGALLDGAGYVMHGDGVRRDPGGRRLSFTIIVGNAPVPPILDLVVQSLKAVGIELSAQAMDLPTLFGRLQSNDDDVALGLYPGPGGTALNSDPDTLRTFFSSRIQGRLQGAQRWVDPEFDRLADRQLVAADVAERRRLIDRMQQIIARDLPALQLYYPTLYQVFRRRTFSSWYYTPGGLAGGVPSAINKQALITGRSTGT